MSHQSDLIATDIDAYLAEHERKDLLRFLTCGSVDDGKSTLIGRLLHDSKMVYEDQLAALHKDNDSVGNAGDHLDLALLTDGLKAEREQGITIDVAYRYFSTAKRKFIIADTPGHEQYTRNMVTGASTCDLAIILIDARHGVLAQTKRHSYIASLLGIDNVAVAINKMDLADYSQDRFDEIVADYTAIADQLGIHDPTFMPMSALLGDNVVDKGDNLDWYDGPTMMQFLETVDVESGRDLDRFRFPVQMVSRPNLNFRGFAGTISAGLIHPGDEVRVQPSGIRTTVERIFTFDGDLDVAGPGQAVTITTAEEVDISRGDVLVSPADPLQRSNEVDAMVVWMSESGLDFTKEYIVQQGNRRVNARISAIHERVDINTLAKAPATSLDLNDIARVTLSADTELLFDPYTVNRQTGSFIVIDRLTNATVGAGMIRSAAGAWESKVDARVIRAVSEVQDAERSIRYGQRPCTIFITGLTGAGKSTLGKALERTMFDRGRAIVRLDGSNMRLGISRDLGFATQERSENVRRTAEVARLVNSQGLIAIASLVAPKSEARERAKELIGDDRFVEVFLDTPVDVCRERDDAGLYEAADRGEIPMFPGVSASYDRPTDADLVLDNSVESLESCVKRIFAILDGRGLLSAAPLS
ncbi:MAG: sulfate adenylyltransferase subunit CysN [Actinomycetia bacterium]|nr:sulfate adenylyltransferase subunit CysN [Actinomycetes bacterium]MCP4958267.1 sulfate adenylyltransferase subunit CysN [Actinomycetes bacterium]